MFLLMGVRFAARAIGSIVALARGDADGSMVDPHLTAAREKSEKEREKEDEG